MERIIFYKVFNKLIRSEETPNPQSLKLDVVALNGVQSIHFSCFFETFLKTIRAI